MSSKRRDADYPNDILEAMERIITYTSELSYAQFMEATRTQDAVLRNTEVIGEALKRLSPPLRKRYPAVPWKDIAAMRDKVIHHHFGINYDIVWAVASAEVPQLRPTIQTILKQIKSYPGRPM
ncbi:MAG: hypothetical protein C4309_13950 [Chloroflexota bacterium]